MADEEHANTTFLGEMDLKYILNNIESVAVGQHRRSSRDHEIGSFRMSNVLDFCK